MKNIIFDFGNVLVRFEPEAVYNTLFGDEAKAWYFLRHVADATWRTRIDAGESQEACIAELKAQHPGYEAAIDAYRDRWEEMLPGEVPGMHTLIADLQEAGAQLYGLTNWSMETFPLARQRFGILQMIERYVVSGAEGLTKPDAHLFQLLLDRYGLQAKECIFVDDNEANVSAACALGMEGIVFRGADDLRRRLGMNRHLTDTECEQLQRNGCSATDWASILVSDGFEPQSLQRCHMHGKVSIGRDTTIEDCHISNSTIGERCHLRNVGWMDNYTIGSGCTIEEVRRMTFSTHGVHADVMNENGGRSIGLAPEMTIGDAYLWARYRERTALMQRFESWSVARGHVGNNTTIVNATAIEDGNIGPNCHIEHGVIAQRFMLGENVRLEAGLRLNDSAVGDNSTLARGEVGSSLIFPAHEQHHNSSFLIAALVQGQSNVAAGATLGSNHNGRTADGEISAGRGFWPGLCVSLKHNCRFAAYTLLAKGDYPAELNITLPFALVSNNTVKNRLEVMPAYWWMHNMYALERNRTKFAARDKRNLRRQHIEFNPLAPDTAEEIIVARELLYMWTTKAYHNEGSTEVQAYGMERGHRRTVILKPGEAYRAYEEMLIYYAVGTLGTGEWPTTEGERTRRWCNIGGQLVAGADLDALIDDIERGRLGSWEAVHAKLNELWAAYPTQRAEHAYGVLCHLAQKKQLDAADRRHYLSRYAAIQQLVRDRVQACKQKDADNEYRQTTFLNTAELSAVMHP